MPLSPENSSQHIPDKNNKIEQNNKSIKRTMVQVSDGLRLLEISVEIKNEI